MKRQLAGTWVQCTGPSVFGPDGGGAVELFSNGTWRQLTWTSSGWQPRHGSNDAGTWQLLPASAAVGTERIGTVRFVAVASAAAPARAPKEWTVRVMLTDGPPKRVQFVDGSLVSNYRLYVPATAAST